MGNAYDFFRPFFLQREAEEAASMSKDYKAYFARDPQIAEFFDNVEAAIDWASKRDGIHTVCFNSRAIPGELSREEIKIDNYQGLVKYAYYDRRVKDYKVYGDIYREVDRAGIIEYLYAVLLTPDEIKKVCADRTETARRILKERAEKNEH